MSADYSDDLAKQIAISLNADGTVSGLVAAIYGATVVANPAWDFIRIGPIDPGAFEASCLDGFESTFPVHCFAKGADDTECRALAKAVVSALDGAHLSFGSPGLHTVSLDWERSQFIRDTAEADAWHAICDFSAQVAADY